ncbi:MAG TPA: DinB family protein [Vicinamibacterales bacterium]|nr:DinB family protein [Vicinamibacterales bacterium]
MTGEQATFLAGQMVNLMYGECAATNKVLGAVKDETRDYRPDPKSRTAWELATHLATADVWFLDSIINGAFTWDPDAAKAAEGQFKTAADVAAFYGKVVPEKMQQVKAMPPEHLTRVMDFFGMMQMPAVSFIGFANNHSVHHRGQLAAYLRAMGSKVPDIYGPSADAEPMK